MGGGDGRERERALTEVLSCERDLIHHQIELLHTELEGIERELGRSRRQALQRERGELGEVLAELEEQIDRDEQARRLIGERLALQERTEAVTRQRLALLRDQRELVLNVFVAGAQLREAQDLARVRATVLEIVVNLIGCEQVGLFERRGARFRLTTTLGLDASRSEDLVADETFIGRRLLSGEPFISAAQPLHLPDPRARGLSVCMPLEAEGQVVAVLLMFELLDQKSGLTPLDLALLELLRNHAGAALTCADRDCASESGTMTWTQA